MTCFCCDISFKTKKGRGQRKNRRSKDGKERHRSTLVIDRYVVYCQNRGMSFDEMWNEFRKLNDYP